MTLPTDFPAPFPEPIGTPALSDKQREGYIEKLKPKGEAPYWPKNMPTSIGFGHIIYTVHVDPLEISDHADGSTLIDITDEVGGSFHASRQIWVQTSSITLEQIQNTLLHEVLHVCVHITGAQYALEQLKTSANVEEAYVSVMTTPLHGVLIQNPDLIEFLTQ